MNNPNGSMASRIKAARLKKGLSQAEIAKRLNLKQIEQSFFGVLHHPLRPYFHGAHSSFPHILSESKNLWYAYGTLLVRSGYHR